MKIQWKKDKVEKSYYSVDKRWYITNSNSEGWVLTDLNSGNRIVRKTLKDCKSKAEEIIIIEDGIAKENVIKINKKPSNIKVEHTEIKNTEVKESSKGDREEIEDNNVPKMSSVIAIPLNKNSVFGDKSVSNLKSVVAKKLNNKPMVQSINSLTPVVSNKL